MFAESIELKNFRNYESLSLKLNPGTNILYGDNAQGKTNILEAVYLCGTTKSHRGARDREMIRFGEEESHIRMSVRRQDIPYRIDMHLKKSRAKGIAINEMPIKKASELFGIMNFVCFSPEDLNIVKHGPAERRRFLNLELCQISRVYMDELANYTKALDQRNRLLKDAFFHPDYLDMLDVWDEQLLSYGRKLIRERRQFLLYLNELLAEIHNGLTHGDEKITLIYEPDVHEEEFEKRLRENRDRDIHSKTTSAGPHRDDFNIQANGIDMRKFGSQGQQRTAALSMKLSEIQIVKRAADDTPVLLLDDVLSELDSSRQNYLLQSISDVQTLITCTGLDEFVEHKFAMDQVYRVSCGHIEEAAPQRIIGG